MTTPPGCLHLAPPASPARSFVRARRGAAPLRSGLLAALVWGAMVLALPGLARAAEEGAQPAAANPFGDVVDAAISLDYPPYEYVLEDGTIEGFNVDVMRAVARTMGFRLELHPMIWTDALEALRSGEVDVISGMLRSDERDEWIDFATPLINVDYSIFVKRGTRGVLGAEDLRGRSVLVERESLMHEFLLAAGMADEAVPVDSEPQALRMLDEGGYAAALVPSQQGLQIAEEFGLDNVEPSGPPIYSTGFGFAVLGGNTAIVERLDRGLADVRRTGEFQDIYNRYFGLAAKSAPGSVALPTWALAGGAALLLAMLGGAGFFVMRGRGQGGAGRPRNAAATGEGLQLGGYELLDLVGAGGMGEVWRARHISLSRPAAIKLIRVEALQGDDESAEHARVRFEREARATAALRSSHTIEIYDYGETPDGAVYYAMELLAGLDLQSLVERFGPLPPERVIHLVRQACQSLEEAHEVGLLHRDIKPANIFACHQGSEYDAVKVLDFGLVKLREQEGSDSVALTRADTITGTPLCLAPEIVLGSEDIDARSDLYSLGCVAYWLITGCTVFEADTAVSMAVAHATEPPVPPSERLGAPVPEDLEAIVLSLLAKAPADRPASAADLERQLGACRDAGAWTADAARSWWRSRAPEVAKSSSEISGAVLSSSR